MSLKKDDILQKKLNKITRDDIQLYLDVWHYDGISFESDNSNVLALQKIWGMPAKHTQQDSRLNVTDQDENRMKASGVNSYGIGQLLYELEVFSDIPQEVREQVSMEDWGNFIIRFIRLYQEKGWKVYCSKQMPLTDFISERLGESIVLGEDKIKGDHFEKYMILQNGNGGRIQTCFEQFKDKKRIEIRRMIVLFRAYIMELLCKHFKTKLQRKNIELFTVNWNWALNHPVYPKSCITSSDIEDREKYSVSQIVNNEMAYENFLRDIYGEQYDLEYIREIMDIPNRLKIETGSVEHENKYGKYLNVSLGERKTEYQPSDYDNTIYLLGGCVFFGYAVEDSQTIASYLQKKLNDKLPGKRWRVVNYGTWGGDIDWTYKRLYQIHFKPGDMVLVSYAGYMPLGLDWEKRDVSEFLKQVDVPQEFYFNGIVHCNKLGYQKVADGIFEMFLDYFEQDSVSGEAFYLDTSYHQNKIYEEQVNAYVENIKDQLPELTGRNIGAIVMNCNPFTLGHQYLIEYASKQVDVLIIFVVEENKSYFQFEDRIKLVRQGTAHLKNVYVVPSGKMIISTVTFPGYFLKDTPEAVGLDTSLDVSIFGKYIAKAFHITTRFVGEEPFDIVTRNYNESMKRILPSYGIKLVIIPRKEMGDTAISASRVRKLLEEKNFAEIKELVPDTTYLYLRDRYGDK